jgi:hypothetical protein
MLIYVLDRCNASVEDGSILFTCEADERGQ